MKKLLKFLGYFFVFTFLNLVLIDKGYALDNVIQLPAQLSWERVYDFSYGGGYTHRRESISCSSENADEPVYGSYVSTYTGIINHAYSVTIHNAQYEYLFTEYQSGTNPYYFMSFVDSQGKETPRITDDSDPVLNLIINADTGEIVDFDSNLNFYYANGLETRKFTPENSGGSNLPIPITPQSVRISISNKNATISWNASANATGYEIEIDGNQVDNIFNTGYIHSNLIPDTQHTYRVRAYNSSGTSEWSSVVTGIIPLSIPTGITSSSTSNSIELKWNAVEGAKGYEIEDNGVIVDNNVNLTYLKTGLSANSSHKFRIRSKGDYSTSGWTSIYTIYTAPNTPTNLVATEAINSVKLTWTASTGATGYEVMIDESTLTTTGVSYTYNNLIQKPSHSYKVRAKNSGGYSDWSTDIVVITAPLDATALNVVNNKVGINDTVAVTSLVEGDIINVYNASTGGTLLGSAIVGAGETSLTVEIAQIGAAEGNVYVTVKRDEKLESARTAKSYTSETSTVPAAASIVVVNNYVGTDDTITVSGLVEGDIINVYTAATGGSLLGSATAASGETSVTISVPQLSSAAGYVYVSVTKVNKLESARTKKAYAVEPTTTALAAAAISVTNNKVGINDVVVVTGLVEGDIIKIYSASTGGTLLGSATVGTGETSVTIEIAQIGAAAGSVYVTVKKDGKLESARTSKSYTSETSTALAAASIVVVNNYVGTDDTITVSGLVEGDIIKVYTAATGGSLLGSATAASGETAVTISVPQLSSAAGNVYVSVTKVNKLESARTTKAYAVEPTTTALAATAISVTNNKVGINDVVMVTGLVERDIIKVYSASTGGTLLGSATVGTVEASVTIEIAQIGAAAGNVYVTVKKDGKLESARTAKSYTSETSAAPAAASIVVVNNYVGTDDTITVSGLVEGDIINVYTAATGGSLLGSATAASGETSVTISVPQLSSAAGYVYVSVTKVNKLESARTKKAYIAEPTI